MSQPKLSYPIAPRFVVTNHKCVCLQERQDTLCVFDGLQHDNEQALPSEDMTQSHQLELRVYIKSGEYFSTLATILDEISDHPELQQIVHDLIYLQQHYIITEKHQK